MIKVKVVVTMLEKRSMRDRVMESEGKGSEIGVTRVLDRVKDGTLKRVVVVVL